MDDYTEPLKWADAKVGTTVALKHDLHYTVVGEITAWVSDPSVCVNGAWYYQTGKEGWSLWETFKPDPLIALIWAQQGMNRVVSSELTEIIRAAGYMTRGEWEAETNKGTHVTPKGRRYEKISAGVDTEGFTALVVPGNWLKGCEVVARAREGRFDSQGRSVVRGLAQSAGTLVVTIGGVQYRPDQGWQFYRNVAAENKP